MSETNIERTPEVSKEEGKVRINSSVKEEMTTKEFTDFYAKKTNQMQDIQQKLNQLKTQLRDYDGVEETEEDRKIKEHLKKAEKLKEKEEIQQQIKKLEQNLEEAQKDVEKFKSTAEEVREIEKNKEK